MEHVHGQHAVVVAIIGERRSVAVAVAGAHL
jgi:hypothetical protein